MVRILLLIFMVGVSLPTRSQILQDVTLAHDFNARVKSINEFIRRFNGEERHPDLTADTTRTRGILTLFDYQMEHAGMSDLQFRRYLQDFVDHVERQQVTIGLADRGMYAEIIAAMTVCDRPVSLTLIMQNQSFSDHETRWAFVGIKGLKAAGIIDTTLCAGVSPVEHELHFMTLNDVFEHDNNSWAMCNRGRDTVIDELSVLLTLAMADKVRIVQIEGLSLHCTDVPGYVFTIKEHGRKGTNSGWLITKLIKTSNNEKSNYLKNLFGL